MAIPTIDERVRYVGVSALRSLNAKTLKELKDVLVLQVDEQPVAVLIPYDIYMEIQRALWPASLVPALEEVFGPAALALAEDARAADLLPDPEVEPDRLAYTESGHEYMRGEQHECGVSDCPANTMGANDKLHETPSPFLERLEIVSAKEFEAEYKQSPHDAEPSSSETPSTFAGGVEPLAQLRNICDGGVDPATIRDNPGPMAFNDLNVLNVKVNGEERGPQEPICSHCGKSSPTTLCSDCFMTGHREGNCLPCAEKINGK